ncbi:serine/threonine protein kinase [Nocardia tengchongensis]|uniref:non-specific serine/threonine protein kinase n=1 Tax=Nocardia tengchongensis TaxID=2055889 RepID=A0ABX8CRZ8_9NOCA|nr:serine/threonine protein kinase [Nocardia tengchongensis]
MTELRPGEVLAGYVIARRIGAGGSGVVYAARHPRLPRLTALKILKRDEVADDDEVWQRFEREADIAAHFDHPNIVQIYDRGVTEDRFWISMQYVDGSDAAELHRVSPDRALTIGGDIGAALDYAHGKGVLHRDVKPSNILIADPDSGRPERALLTDFGIARLRDETTKLTQTGNISATFAFASPEQVSGKPVGPRSDQYSLACTLFVLLTDHRPFSADNPLAWVHAHTRERPRRVSELNPALPAALDEVFDRALAKDPEDRFDNCADFAYAAAEAYYSDPALAVTARARMLPHPPARSVRRRKRKPLSRTLTQRRILIPLAVAAVAAGAWASRSTGAIPRPSTPRRDWCRTVSSAPGWPPRARPTTDSPCSRPRSAIPCCPTAWTACCPTVLRSTANSRPRSTRCPVTATGSSSAPPRSWCGSRRTPAAPTGPPPSPCCPTAGSAAKPM